MSDLYAEDVVAMEAAGAALARALGEAGAVVYLSGDLGAGKTTLVRGVARGLGITGRVRSPTYTLVEGYELASGMLYHLDLYRLSGAGELEFLGIRDLEAPTNKVFIEWPERVAEGSLPAADLVLALSEAGEGRRIEVRAVTPRGATVTSRWLSEIGDEGRAPMEMAGADSKSTL